MSFTIIEQATPRLHRSELAVPGSNPAMFEKAAKSAADIIFLDCEDAVAPDDKEMARRNIVQALNEIDWGTKTMMVRINGLDTHYMYRDVVDIVEACPRLDMILIPKVGVPQDVYAVDMMVTQIEAARKRSKRIGFEVLIETALGMANVEAIAQSSKRLEAMSFGVADYAASTRARTTVIGGVNKDSVVLTDRDEAGKRQAFWTDPWHAAQTRMLVACRAYGLRPIDGPFGDIKTYNGRDFYVSWYPRGLMVDSSGIAPPPAPAQDTAREAAISREILERLTAILPCVERIASDAESMVLRGGWVSAAGRGVLSDPRSTLHRRDEFGIVRLGSYVSVDTGKYASAPLLAHRIAQSLG